MLGSDFIASDWILLPDHFDTSLVRNYTAFYFARQMNTSMRYVPGGQHVHLYINGEYVGVYLVTDERDNDRMDLTWHDDPSLSDFFLEMCRRVPGEGGVQNRDWVNVHGSPFDIRMPSAYRSPVHAEYIRNYLVTVFNTIGSQIFEEIIMVIDLETWVDFIIINEITRNHSIGYSNVFMYTQGHGNSRMLYLGPVWDFDLSMGRFFPYSQHTEGLLITDIYSNNNSFTPFRFLYHHLMDVPEFRNAVEDRWNELVLESVPELTISHIMDLVTEYEYDFNRNFVRHPVFGIMFGAIGGHTPPEILEIHSFTGQVEFLADWLSRRVEWLDAYFNTHANQPPDDSNNNGGDDNDDDNYNDDDYDDDNDTEPHTITISAEKRGFTGFYRTIEIENTTADFMVVSVFGFDDNRNVRFMATMIRLDEAEKANGVFDVGYNFAAQEFTVWLMKDSAVPNLADPFYEMEYYNVAVRRG
jgi:hypothetical protein